MLAYQLSVDLLLELLGRKGCYAILRGLLDGKQRFGQLQSLTGLPPRTLSQRLKELEEAGLISRTSYPEVPPRVDYSLTPKGQQLRSTLSALGELTPPPQAALARSS